MSGNKTAIGFLESPVLYTNANNPRNQEKFISEETRKVGERVYKAIHLSPTNSVTFDFNAERKPISNSLAKCLWSSYPNTAVAVNTNNVYFAGAGPENFYLYNAAGFAVCGEENQLKYVTPPNPELIDFIVGKLLYQEVKSQEERISLLFSIIQESVRNTVKVETHEKVSQDATEFILANELESAMRDIKKYAFEILGDIKYEISLSRDVDEDVSAIRFDVYSRLDAEQLMQSKYKLFEKLSSVVDPLKLNLVAIVTHRVV
jgi:hypothetical protein